MTTHVKRVLSHRFLLAISLVLTMLVFSFVLAQPPKAVASAKATATATASACPSHTIEYTYYTDASMTVECGWKIITCYCGGGSGGCRTAYYTIDWSDC